MFRHLISASYKLDSTFGFSSCQGATDITHLSWVH